MKCASGLMGALEALFFSAAAFGQGGTVAISGRVVDDSGSPVASTTVYYRNNQQHLIVDRVGHSRVVGSLISSTVTTAKDGTFTVAGLPPDVYWLCAEGTQQNQIRSCDWGSGATKVDLSGGLSAANATLLVHTGVALTFVVADARGQIKDFSANATALAAPGNFRVFAVNGSWFRPATFVSAAAGVRQYSLIVPKGRSYRLLVDTKLNVLNESLKPVTSGALDDTIAVAAAPSAYNLTMK